MAADTALLVEYPLTGLWVARAVNAARLIQERKDVRHFLRVQLWIRLVLSSDLPPHGGSMVPQYRYQPPHCGGTRVLSIEIRGDLPPGSIDGMANAALLVTIKQLGALLRRSDDIEGAAVSGRPADLHEQRNHQHHSNQSRRDPKDKLFA